MTTDLDNILEKVRALLAKGASTTSEDEASNCASLAQRLLEKHNLSMADLKPEEGDGAGQENIDAQYVEPWRSTVVSAACRLYYCSFFHSTWYDKAKYDKKRAEWTKEWQAFNLGPTAGDNYARYKLHKTQPCFTKFSRPRFVVVGRPHNRAVAVEMIPYLWNTVVRLAYDYARDLPESQLEGKTRRATMLEFTRGCGERVASRMYQLAYDAKRAQKKQTKGAGTAVALYEQFDTENEAYKATLDLISRRRGGINSDGAHADAGSRAGDGISLSPQMGGTGSRAAALPAPRDKR